MHGSTLDYKGVRSVPWSFADTAKLDCCCILFKYQGLIRMDCVDITWKVRVAWCIHMYARTQEPRTPTRECVVCPRASLDYTMS